MPDLALRLAGLAVAAFSLLLATLGSPVIHQTAIPVGLAGQPCHECECQGTVVGTAPRRASLRRQLRSRLSTMSRSSVARLTRCVRRFGEGADLRRCHGLPTTAGLKLSAG